MVGEKIGAEDRPRDLCEDELLGKCSFPQVEGDVTLSPRTDRRAICCRQWCLTRPLLVFERGGEHTDVGAGVRQVGPARLDVLDGESLATFLPSD